MALSKINGGGLTLHPSPLSKGLTHCHTATFKATIGTANCLEHRASIELYDGKKTCVKSRGNCLYCIEGVIHVLTPNLAVRSRYITEITRLNGSCGFYENLYEKWTIYQYTNRFIDFWIPTSCFRSNQFDILLFASLFVYTNYIKISQTKNGNIQFYICCCRL